MGVEGNQSGRVSGGNCLVATPSSVAGVDALQGKPWRISTNVLSSSGAIRANTEHQCDW